MFPFQIQFSNKKEIEEVVKFGRCKTCRFYKAKDKLCKKYNMISEIYQSCKGHVETNSLITAERHR